MPLFSIITVNKDNLEGLKRTAESVVSQTFKDFEWIVIDAASTDGSAEFVRQNESYMSYWVSEPDGGIYAGMNKGILKAKGKYVQFLNSGDVFADENVLENVSKNNDGSDILIGRINFWTYEGVYRKDYAMRQPHITLFSLFLYGISHQASFISRRLFDECGLYDETVKIVADWKFFVEAIINHNCSYKNIPVTIANFDRTGVSSRNGEKMVKERVDVFRKMFPPRIVEDYAFAFDHHYDMYRLQWLAKHPKFYMFLRKLISLGMRRKE